MNIASSDRRVSARHNFKLPLRVRIWKSAIPEQRAELENLSERGIYFPTNFAAARGWRRPGPVQDAEGNYRRAGKRMAVLGSRGSHGAI